MRKGVRGLVVVGILFSSFLLSGCFFNVLQTARTLHRGEVGLTLGVGLLNFEVLPLENGEGNLILTPQARLAAGIADGVELGLHTGIMVSPTAEQPGFLGVVGDLKLALVHDPDSLSLALGFGGGWSLPMAGWGVQGGIYLDSNLQILPLYFAYRPILPLTAEEFTIWHQLAMGLHLRLSDTARLLLEVDSFNGLWGIALGLELGL